MSTLGVRAADTRDALEIVATGAKPLAQLLDTFKAVPAVGGSVLLIVTVAEIVKMPFEDGMEFVAPTGNVLIPLRGCDRDRRAHIDINWRIRLLASDRRAVHRSHDRPSPL